MSIKEHPPRPVHTPVLLEQTLEWLAPQPGMSYLDLTAGYGGHASAVLARTGMYETSVLVDRDPATESHLASLTVKGTELRQSDFATAAHALADEHRTFDLILADLGVSSPQLDRAERGFSFSKSGPLDMRMDQASELTAAGIVNTYDETSLVDIIMRYGEEPRPVARRIAAAIVAERPFEMTDQLASVIQAITRGPRKRIHPATRTFQALRIEVNQELAQVEALLPLLPKLLNPGGRVAIISFHSLEDRLVKSYFSEQRQAGFEAELEILTKKPISADHDDNNPRARSAKLRVAAKINTERGELHANSHPSPKPIS